METFAPTTTVTPSIACFKWQESFVPNNTPLPNVCSPPSCALQCAPNTKTHPQWCVFVFGTFPTFSNACQARNTPMLVCFRVRHVFYALECTPSMKQHTGWCFFMFDAFPVPSNVCRARNHTLTSVFSCSAPVLYLRMQ